MFKKILTFVSLLVFSNNLKCSDLIIDEQYLRDLQSTIVKAENFYLNIPQDYLSKYQPYYVEKEVLDNLYKFKNDFSLYLFKFKDSDSFIKIYKSIEEVYYPLVKEVIRKLEDHIEKTYGDRRSFFQKHKKAVILSTLGIVLTSGLLYKYFIKEEKSIKG